MEAAPVRRLRIELNGDFWGQDALALAEKFPLSELADVDSVVVSLERVGRIDEAGLAILVRFYSHLRIRGIELQLADVPVSVRELLQRVGFDRLMTYAEGSDSMASQRTIALQVRPGADPGAKPMS